MSPHRRLELRVGRLLTAGGAISTGLLLVGLGLRLVMGEVMASAILLDVGLVVLMATPVMRVILSCAEYVRARDWFFASITFAVLGVLAAAMIVAIRQGR